VINVECYLGDFTIIEEDDGKYRVGNSEVKLSGAFAIKPTLYQ